MQSGYARGRRTTTPCRTTNNYPEQTEKRADAAHPLVLSVLARPEPSERQRELRRGVPVDLVSGARDALQTDAGQDSGDLLRGGAVRAILPAA